MRCKQCNKFIKKGQHFCNTTCCAKFEKHGIRVPDLVKIQKKYSKNKPDDFLKIVKSQISKKKNDKILKSLSNKDVSFWNIAECVVQSNKSKRIYCMSTKDVEQEMRLCCAKVYNTHKNKLKKFSNKYIFNFLKTCVHNYLYNMQRGTMLPNNQPCIRCTLYDKKTHKCMHIDTERECKYMQGYYRRMKFKRELSQSSLQIDPSKIDYRQDVIAVAFLGEIE